MKKTMICVAILLVTMVSTAKAQEENKKSYFHDIDLHEDIDVYLGFTQDFAPNYKFDKADKMNGGTFFTAGIRYKTPDEFFCWQVDHSFGLSYLSKFSSSYILGTSLDFCLLPFPKSYVSLGVRYQEKRASFEDKANGVYDKYTIKTLRSVGPILRYKNREWNLEMGYLFGVNKAQWQNLDNTAILNKERVNTFYLKASINLSVLK